MEALFLKLLDLSWSAGWLVLAVLALRLVLKKAPKWIICCLWALVAVRLLCPVSFESKLSLIPEANPLESVLSRMPDAISAPKEASAAVANAEPGDIVYAHSAPAGPEHGESESEIYLAAPAANGDTKVVGPIDPAIWAVGSVIWAVGIGAMLLNALWSYHRIRQKVAPSIDVGNHVLLCDYIDTPFILGIFRPKIYLPSSLPPDQAAYVLSHERAHLHRRDHWWKPLGYVLLSVYWFHPLLWLGYILLCRDIELACDERVIRDMESGAKKAYAEALLDCSVPRSMIAACPLAFGEVDVKERVRSVLHYKKPGFWILLIALVLCVILAVCFLTDPYTTTLSQLSGVDRQEIDSIYLSSTKGSVILAGEREMDPLWQLLDSVTYDPKPYREEVYLELDKFDFASFQCLKFLRDNEELGLLYFLSDFTTVCALDEKGVLHYYHAYRTDPMDAFFDAAVLPMTGREVTAEPFAAADDPYSWTSGITPEAVNLAEQYIYQYGIYSLSNVSEMRFRALTELLNALPQEAFGPAEDFTDRFPDFNGVPVNHPNVAVNIADHANSFSVSVRYYQEQDGSETIDLIIVDSLRLMESRGIGSGHSCLRWEIRDDALLCFLRELYEHPSYARERLAGYMIWSEEPLTALSGGISIRLGRASGWEYETVAWEEGTESFGIRCRPKEVEEGWLYFSFWPGGYNPAEENRYYRVWSSTGSDVKDWVTSFRPSAGLRISNDPWRNVWSYQKWCTTLGDFAIINTLSKEAFMKYEVEIEVHENYCEFNGGEPVAATIP